MSGDSGSDWTQFDGGPPTEKEMKQFRAMLQEHEREAWMRRKIRVFVPWLVAVVGAAWALVEWFTKYFELRGRP